MFNVKRDRLPPGSLIRFNKDYWVPYAYDALLPSIISEGSTGLVIEHWKPVYIKVLVEEKIVNLDFVDRVPLHGYVSDIELFQLPVGKKLEKW